MTNLREAAQMALDAATEELPKVDERETVFCSIQGHHLRALCEFVRAALAQPEPEPVAWMERERAVGYREGHQAALKQREWQGLTDEEGDAVLNSMPFGHSYKQFYEAIEAKLKEKNYG